MANETPVAAPTTTPSPSGSAAALASIPAASDPPAAPPAAPAAAAPPPWYGEKIDPTVKAWVDGKKYQDPATALAAHMNAEKFLGVPADQLVRKPKDASDAEGMKAFRAAIGVPTDAQGYELVAPADAPGSKDFADWASNTFLTAGVPKEAAGVILNEWNKFAAAEMTKMAEAAQTEFTSGMTKLKDDWGSAYDERIELAKRTFRTFGAEIGIKEVTDQSFKDLEKAAGGGVQLIKLLAAVGSRTSEDTFQGAAPQAFSMTPEQAATKLATLRNDKTWSKEYLSGDKNKMKEMQELQQIIAGTAK